MSLKDVVSDWKRLQPVYEARLEATKELQASNRHLQALVWAKAQCLAVGSAAEAIDLAKQSERAFTGLTIAAASSPPQPVRGLRCDSPLHCSLMTHNPLVAACFHCTGGSHSA